VHSYTNQGNQGDWKGAASIPSYTLEQRDRNLHGEQKQPFLSYAQNASAVTRGKKLPKRGTVRLVAKITVIDGSQKNLKTP
jgi:hypothetical protein